MDLFKKEAKDPTRDDIPSGLLRQRRNLIIISLVLLFVYHSGVRIETASLSIFGADLTLENPSVFDDFQILWVAWFYFIIRYTQYIRFYGVMSDITTEYYDYLNPLFTHYFLKSLSEKLGDHFLGNPQVNPYYVRFSLTSGFQYTAPGYVGKSYTNMAHVQKMAFVKTMYCIVKASVSLITKSRHVTDYWLPYCVAIFPLGFLLLRLLVD